MTDTHDCDTSKAVTSHGCDIIPDMIDVAQAALPMCVAPEHFEAGPLRMHALVQVVVVAGNQVRWEQGVNRVVEVRGCSCVRQGFSRGPLVQRRMGAHGTFCMCKLGVTSHLIPGMHVLTALPSMQTGSSVADAPVEIVINLTCNFDITEVGRGLILTSYNTYLRGLQATCMEASTMGWGSWGFWCSPNMWLVLHMPNHEKKCPPILADDGHGAGAE